jgi:hypothetical protein
LSCQVINAGADLEDAADRLGVVEGDALDEHAEAAADGGEIRPRHEHRIAAQTAHEDLVGPSEYVGHGRTPEIRR